MHLTKKRVLLFDIDGTLMDSGNEGLICFRRALEDVFGVTGPIDTYDMAGKTDWQILNDLMGMAGVDADEIEAHRAEAFAAYARHVEASAPVLKMRALPGAPALLESLVPDPGFSLGLVTGNVKEVVPYKLRAVGFDPAVFRFGAFGSEHIDRNVLPSLAYFQELHARSGNGAVNPPSWVAAVHAPDKAAKQLSGRTGRTPPRGEDDTLQAG